MEKEIFKLDASLGSGKLRRRPSLSEGDIGVCGIAVMTNFSCGISVILI